MLAQTIAPAPSEVASPARVLPEGVVPVLLAFIASRLMVCGVVVLSRLQLPPGHFFPRGGLLDVLSSGDAARYVRLLDAGPWLRSAAHDPAQAFFPVFPLLLEMMSALVGKVALAGVLIANLCLFGAGMLLYRLMRLEYPDDPRTSRIAVMLLMFSPASYFFTAGVPDSTALVFAIGSLLAAVQRRWVVASICGLLLCGTVNIGFWIVVPLLVEYFRQTRQTGGPVDSPGPARALAVGAVLLPLAAAIAFGYAWLNDPSALLRLSTGSELTLASLVRMSRYFEGWASFYEWIFRAVLLLGVVLCLAGFARKIRITYLAFALTVVAVCFWSHDLQAARTIGLAFPLVVIMAALTQRFDALYEPFLTCSMTLLAVCSIMAANGFWLW